MPCIPGLTSQAFQAGTRHSAPTPELTQSHIESDGSFDFAWTAMGSSVYKVTAKGKMDGTSPVGLEIDCNCPSFSNLPPSQQEEDPPSVCKHLFAALSSVLDETATTGMNEKIKQQHQQQQTKRSSSSSSSSSLKETKRQMSYSLARSSKKPAVGPIEAPIKLFCTVQDAELRKQHVDKNHWSWTQCQTLREMIGVGTGNKIQWLIIANFLIDFDFLLNQVPELLSIPHVVVFYGHADNSTSAWTQACSPGHTVDFVKLDPKDPDNSPLRYTFFGVHHTKLFLVGHTNKIRVVIHTANLRHGDIHSKAQAAYIQDFCLKSATAPAEESCEFQDTLINYVTSYGYKTKQSWLGNDLSDLLTECLCRYDYSSAQAVLIPSVPGYYNLYANHRMGHLKLKQAIAEHTVYSVKPRPIVCQFSSLGMLSENFLRQLQASMDTGLARRDYDPSAKTPLQLQLVYPTVEEICNSIEGCAGGASVPGKLKNVSKPFIRPLFCKWSAHYNPSTKPAENPLQKTHNVPHIKTWYQVSESGDSMDWLVVTSHNLSKAAFGEIRKRKEDGSQYHYVSSWELGVFVSPSVLGVDKLVYWSGADEQPGSATVPMPYKMYQPDRYTASDKPWAVDALDG